MNTIENFKVVLNKLPLSVSDKQVILDVVAKCQDNNTECKIDVATKETPGIVKAVNNIVNVDPSNVTTAKLAGTVNSILDALREAGIMK